MIIYGVIVFVSFELLVVGGVQESHHHGGSGSLPVTRAGPGSL